MLGPDSQWLVPRLGTGGAWAPPCLESSVFYMKAHGGVRVWGLGGEILKARKAQGEGRRKEEKRREK